MQPKVSVLMANYNNSKYIEAAIESVFNQDLKEWELIIIDDFSTDDSLKKIKSFLFDGRIRLIKNNSNLGYIRSLKKLINLSKTDILCILDSDDVLNNNALSSVYNIYQNNNEYGFIYSQFDYYDKNLNYIKKGYCSEIPKGRTNLQCDCVSHFKTFKKSCYLKTDGYDEEIVYAEDKDLIFKMEEVTGLYFINKSLYKYRVLSNSQGNDPRKALVGKISFILARLSAFKRRNINKIPNLTYKEMMKYLFRGSYYSIKIKEFKRTIYFLFLALKLFFKRI